jgi:tRNA nucleotidyltransferase (CCA-adding enzyme)
MNTELKHLLVNLTTGDTPHLAMQAARQDGSLARLIPELDVLYGVPQNAEYHPEVDTGIHCELVLQVAADLSSRPRVRFAALVHDFGKGLTPPHEWPKHLEHEETGVAVVEQFCNRAGVPDDWRWLGMATSRWHLFPHRALESRPGTLVKLLVESGFINEPELFEDFLLACEADKRGRGGMLDTDYPQRALLQEAMKAVKAVNVTSSDRPYQDALTEARCVAVKAILPRKK